MNPTESSPASRREISQEQWKSGRRHGLGRRGRSAVSMRRRTTRFKLRWSAAAAGHRRGGDALSVKTGPIKLVAMADVFKDRLDRQPQLAEEQFDDGSTCPRSGSSLASTPTKGDGLPEAGRHRDLRHAAGVPLGPFHLRHRKGPERLHGEAATADGPTRAKCSSWPRTRRQRTSRSASA